MKNDRDAGKERHTQNTGIMTIAREGRVWMRGCWVSLTAPSQKLKDYYDVLLAFVFFFIAQILTCAWEKPFWATGLYFPGQIVAMLFLWLVMWAIQVLFCDQGEGLEGFYHSYLKNPTEVLNKHMSIGFTVPFLNLMSRPTANKDQVGLLTAAFVVTGVLNSILVYLVAYHVQLTSTKIICCLRCNPVLDVKAKPTQAKATATALPQMLPRLRPSYGHDDHCAHFQLRSGCKEESRLDRLNKHISDSLTLCTLNGCTSNSNGLNVACCGEAPDRGEDDNEKERSPHKDSQLQSQVKHETSATEADGSEQFSSTLSKIGRVCYAWLSGNVFLTLSLLLLFLVGIPVSFFRHNDLLLDIGFLFTVWLSFTTLQMRAKQQTSISHRHKKSLAAIATILNPVLWTSLFLVCYGLAKSGIRNQSTVAVVEGLRTKNTVSDLIAHHVSPSAGAANETSSGHIRIGAADLATSILNAGIVSWGLKLFEYRHQIASSGGLTVIVTSLLASLLNVVAWPLVAHAIGVRPTASELSFAARSVTIALGGAAMKSLGGDVGVNALGVVMNGVCFQLVAGFLAEVGGLSGAAVKCKGSLVHCGDLVWIGSVWGRPKPDLQCSLPNDEEGQQGARDAESQFENDHEMRYSSDVTHVGEQRPHGQCNEDCCSATHRAANIHDGNTTTEPTHGGDEARADHDVLDDPLTIVPTVAAGVTIGINAAAMGTVHLYEQNSHAAPYSALSMTIFGVFTVLLTVRGPMSEWIVSMVGGVSPLL